MDKAILKKDQMSFGFINDKDKKTLAAKAKDDYRLVKNKRADLRKTDRILIKDMLGIGCYLEKNEILTFSRVKEALLGTNVYNIFYGWHFKSFVEFKNKVKEITNL